MNPEILTWARETAGLSLEQGAHAIGLKDAYGKKGAERLAELEAGEDTPTYSVLSRMAKAYRRSLLVFYLSNPPRIGDRGQDFRRIRGSEEPPYNPELDALIRDIKSRQDIVRSALEDLESDLVPFVGSAPASLPVASLSREITRSIGFSLDEFRQAKSADSAFAYLRSKIEATGVFVLLVGDLGSYHTRISTDIFRGFAIADRRAPLVVVNDQDPPAARSFTAVHELAHVWLGNTGVSGDTTTSNRIEQYCNDVAAEFLLPASELRQFPRGDLRETIAGISAFAAERNVSRPMVAYRLYRLGNISSAEWSRLNAHFKKEWLQYKEKEAAKKQPSDTGPNYYIVRRHRLGSALLDVMRRSLGEGVITYTKAGRVLGVKPRNVGPLLQAGSGG